MMAIQPTFAASWVEIGNWQFIDKDSVKRYVNDKGRTEFRKKTFWRKDADTNQDYMMSIEQLCHKKIGYIIAQEIIDYKKNKVASKTIIVYDGDSNIITNIENEDASLEWQDILPNSIGEKWYNLVKSPRTLKKMYKAQTQK